MSRAPSGHEPGRIVVVGAGIVGASCARELALRGHRVVLLEAEGLGEGTSCRAMGHVGVFDEGDAQLQLTALARRTWDEISTSLPTPVGYARRGALWLARRDEDLHEAATRAARLERTGVDCRLLEPTELYSLEPHLVPGLTGGLLVPGDAIVDANEATRFLVEGARRAGATVRFGSPVVGLEAEEVRLESGERLRTTRTVVAAGWQSPRLLPGLAVRPRKGHIALTAPRPGWVRHNVSEIGYMSETLPDSEESVALVVQPRPDGRYLLGATRQFVGPTADVEASILERLRERVYEYVPSLRELPIERVWTGLRPAGPDSVPCIGPWPDQPRWLVATGHEGIGITTCLATGRLIAELVEGTTPSIPLAPFDPARAIGPRRSAV
jgi:D-hydroxyproline dehydrogenase subunit beta